MTVHPFPLAAPRAPTPSARQSAIPFPIIARGTALVRRHPTPADFAHGNLVRPFPPRAGKVTLLLADTAAEAARDRHAALKARAAKHAAALAAPRPSRLARLIAWAASPAPPVVAVLTGALACAVVVGLLLGAWS